MAKIKIKGHNELIDISDFEAKKIQDFWLDDDKKDNEKVKVRGTIVKKSDIVFIHFREDERRGNVDPLEEHYRQRDERLLLSPREKAEKCGWGPFTLFYWGLYKRKPDESLRQKVLESVIRFYEENSGWTVPSMKLWYTFLDLPKDVRLNESVNRILLRVEESQLEDIRKAKKGPLSQINLEEREKIVEKVGLTFFQENG